VVLDKDGFAQKAVLGVAESEHFMVAGIVDIDSIPEDKEHIPLGGDNNPIPLVEFLPSPGVNKNRGIRTEKIGRNDPCPCGSGKKYKKCCMGKLIA
jgi:preprotein translocase subunit SecA